MAKKYVNFRVGGVPERKDDSYTVWTNDLLNKLINDLVIFFALSS